MVSYRKLLSFLLMISILGACASRWRDQMRLYREAFAAGDYEKAENLLNAGELKKDRKSQLLWLLEKGSLQLARDQVDEAIASFQASLDLIDQLFTKRLSTMAISLLLDDTTEEFTGASYERSYAHYYLARAYYARYLKSQSPRDLQGARATILAWDSYFQELQRSASYKTLYQTDLMLKLFGGQIHEISGIRHDKQISLQLYKDALKILDSDAGIFSLFNKQQAEFVKHFAAAVKAGKGAPVQYFEKTPAYQDLRNLLHYKILSLTQEIRGGEFNTLSKSLDPSEAVKKKLSGKKTNVILVLEEGLIPAKVGKSFNFGIRGAMDAVDNPAAKKFIATVGVAAVSLFAMNNLKLMPPPSASPGNFLFAYDMTRLAVTEAAISFELPMIDSVPLVQRMELFVLDDKGVVVHQEPLPVVAENGDLARVVLEEDVVSRYVKTGSRVAAKHLVAIVTAMQIYRSLSKGNQGDFLAQAAAMGSYVAASKGIAEMEKADTRHWTTLPQALRVTELALPAGNYQIALGAYSGEEAPTAPGKILGNIQVQSPTKSLHHLKFISAN
jgi:hypothetical protein